NYLNNILAKIDGINKNSPEAIMLTHDNYVSECTGDNIFIVKKGVLSTPPRTISLKGITQDSVISIARKKRMRFNERNMRLSDIYTADECFLTGTAAEIVPVTKVDGHVIGSGEPGCVTRELMEDFRALTKRDGVKY
ncbi:MAG: aminotransferase class IV, partial [Candidatus Omnitrophica bacterium]|nr:aminotransferase class IV [Candidatus Omnitrophota bacterium]